MSSDPSSSAVCVIASSTAARSVTSSAIAAPPISAATACAPSRLTSDTITRAPAIASAVAIPLPMPFAPPVTCATLPVRSIQAMAPVRSLLLVIGDPLAVVIVKVS